ncbi:MAG TPA: DUF2721 domain-containing protein [Bryobacteraceae bacterium]|nr:DUF2721 domain-containing protein [Bryobacteraceae bacterium]
MPGLNDNPFAVLTAVVAPAILTNACSVLALGTANRVARVVDRTRVVIAGLGSLAAESADYAARTRELERLKLRGRLLLTALRSFYAALGAFAASALGAVVGAVLASYDIPIAFHFAAAVAFGAGAIGVTALVSGCVGMVRENRLAIQSIAEEVELARTHRHDGL